MASLEINTSDKRLEIVGNDRILDSNFAGKTEELLDLLETMDRFVSIEKFLLSVNTLLSDSDNLVFDYLVKLTDGRTWTQTLTFDANDLTKPPRQTFDVKGTGWKFNEFKFNDSIRANVINKISLFGVNKIEFLKL